MKYKISFLGEKVEIIYINPIILNINSPLIHCKSIAFSLSLKIREDKWIDKVFSQIIWIFININ